MKDLSIPVNDDFLTKLTNSNIRLNRLSIPHSWILSDATLLNCVQKWKDIQIIDITSCERFGSSLIIKLIDILKNLKRRNRLKLIVTCKFMRLSDEAKQTYSKYKYLLKLTYHK